MKLVYFRGHQLNFGDDLNAVLWPRLAPSLFEHMDSESFLGVGTIIGMPTPESRLLHVFSSGVGYDALDAWRVPRRLWCVRGPLSAQLLGEPQAALTDGAILAPDVLGSPHTDDAARTGVVVVPHWESLRFAGWPQACEEAGFRLVSPIDTPASVYSRIAGAGLVLTESLHGAIFADTLGIPWIAFASTRNVSAFKWVDWTLSVGVRFAPFAIAPPSAAAALTFGRPDRSTWGTQITIDAEAAVGEFRSRAAFRARAVAAPRPSATGRARAILRRAAQHSAVVSRVLGHTPSRTAALLATAARGEATLSRATRREELRTEMLERLQTLVTEQRQARRLPATMEGR